MSINDLENELSDKEMGVIPVGDFVLFTGDEQGFTVLTPWNTEQVFETVFDAIIFMLGAHVKMVKFQSLIINVLRLKLGE